MNQIIGIDIGGSHISSGLVDVTEKRLLNSTLKRTAIVSDINPGEFFQIIEEHLQYHRGQEHKPTAIAISIPGPFDYKQGISKIYGLGKFDSFFGLNIKQGIVSRFPDLKEIDIQFFNDATSMLFGQVHHAGLTGRVAGITLGTGFGSSFFVDGQFIQGIHGIPESGFLFESAFKDSIADDYFSTRWLVNEYERIAGLRVKDVKSFFSLENNQKYLQSIFEKFGNNLAEFMSPFLLDFKAKYLLIGGGIAASESLFIPMLKQGLIKKGVESETMTFEEGDHLAILGAAIQYHGDRKKEAKPWRKTSQYILPGSKQHNEKGSYDIYPALEISNGKITNGYGQLAGIIAKQKTVILDGYIGVFWENVVKNLLLEFHKMGCKANFFDVSSAMLAESDIVSRTRLSMGEPGSIFGKKYPGTLEDFFDPEILTQFKEDTSTELNILYGCGASLAAWSGLLVYFDLPKNELQFRSRAGFVTNLGLEEALNPAAMYKRFYFIDWIVLNKQKQKILPHVDVFVDEQRMDDIAIISGDDLRAGLNQMATSYFRVRPWFEPGPWGGQWIAEHIDGLEQDVPNYAWSFELIVPENGLLIKSGNKLLECSFDLLMYIHAKEVLGHAYDVFKTEFPIRFDFLDTFNGGNLSIQCHPRPAYIKSNFGETFTQDETYYILDAADDAEVYLGFTADIEKEKFRDALTRGVQTGDPVDIEKFVQKHPAKKHDLFLIPGGTIHASGAGSLVLEISNTPYIFTFKMYDWQRLDLNGQPRPINIDHAFKNLYFDRKGSKIQTEFISHPKVMEKGTGYTIVHLPTHKDHFYDVRRIEIDQQISLQTGEKFLVCMLVEGEAVMLQIRDDEMVRFNYAETFVIPASAGEYRFINQTDSKVKIIQAFVKDIINI